MQKTPYRASLGTIAAVSSSEARGYDWREGLPVLYGTRVTLRELRATDATSLCALLNTEEVGRFISRPPPTVEGFVRFIAWTHRQRTAGTYTCFAVTLHGYDTAIGIIQVRQLGGRFENAEWGFALGSAFWGTGSGEESAALAIDFAFDAMGVRRLEAREAVVNGRGTSALPKVGAVQECQLRKSFLCGGKYIDQALFTILDSDRQRRHAARLRRVEQIH